MADGHYNAEHLQLPSIFKTAEQEGATLTLLLPAMPRSTAALVSGHYSTVRHSINHCILSPRHLAEKHILECKSAICCLPVCTCGPATSGFDGVPRCMLPQTKWTSRNAKCESPARSLARCMCICTWPHHQELSCEYARLPGTVMLPWAEPPTVLYSIAAHCELRSKAKYCLRNTAAPLSKVPG